MTDLTNRMRTYADRFDKLGKHQHGDVIRRWADELEPGDKNSFNALGGEWQLVPIEPTEAMHKACYDLLCLDVVDALGCGSIENWPKDETGAEYVWEWYIAKNLWRVMLQAARCTSGGTTGRGGSGAVSAPCEAQGAGDQNATDKPQPHLPSDRASEIRPNDPDFFGRANEALERELINAYETGASVRRGQFSEPISVFAAGFAKRRLAEIAEGK